MGPPKTKDGILTSLAQLQDKIHVDARDQCYWVDALEEAVKNLSPKPVCFTCDVRTRLESILLQLHNLQKFG